MTATPPLPGDRGAATSGGGGAPSGRGAVPAGGGGVASGGGGVPSGGGASSGGGAFDPTHVVPRGGLAAWEAPDGTRLAVRLDPLLPVRLVARRGDWGQVVCSNGWSTWVDARTLVVVPRDPPAADGPDARTEDPLPLLARVEQALGRYRRAAAEAAAGRLDGEGFRRDTQGLRIGAVVDGEAVWLYDAEGGRWVYGEA
ncbi:hypothetical protein, partial [Streptomyces sp. URMC 123]|uniref:hypothetical protein n=1 Tax=Streptomyces sp. URMC 123 TaxID=3423403 RepID=UPI003F1D61A6